MNTSPTTSRFNNLLEAVAHAKENGFAVAVAATVDGETLDDFFASPEFKKGVFLSTLFPIIQCTPGTGITAIRVTHDFRSDAAKEEDACIFNNAKESIKFFTNELEELEDYRNKLTIHEDGVTSYVIKAGEGFVDFSAGGKRLVSSPIAATQMGMQDADELVIGMVYKGQHCKAVKLENAMAYRAHILRSLILTIRTTY